MNKPNPAYDSTIALLREAGYQRLNEFKRAREHGVIIPEERFEIWGGRKGVVIAQVWKDGHGVHLYADWPLGNSFDQLKAAL